MTSTVPSIVLQDAVCFRLSFTRKSLQTPDRTTPCDANLDGSKPNMYVIYIYICIYFSLHIQRHIQRVSFFFKLLLRGVPGQSLHHDCWACASRRSFGGIGRGWGHEGLPVIARYGVGFLRVSQEAHPVFALANTFVRNHNHTHQ